jgi:flagellar assembly protein FliH
MTARVEKFAFDEDFAADRRSPGGFRRAADIEKLRAATEEAYRNGQMDGRREAEQEASMRLAQAMEAVNRAALEALGRLDAEARRTEREAADLAAIFARKLAGTLLARLPLGALEEAAIDCLRELVGVPHIAVRVPTAHVTPAKDLLDRLAAEHGYAGRLVVLGEGGLREGDFRLEWADGGVVRDVAATEHLIGEAIARHCNLG